VSDVSARLNTADCHARVTLVDERHAGLTLEDHELTDRRVHLAGALPAPITSVFPDRGWLARGPGRGLRVDDDFDGNIEKWLAI